MNAANGMLSYGEQIPPMSFPSEPSEKEKVYNITTTHDDHRAISLSTSQYTETATAKPSHAADEQGIRAYLYNLLNSQHLFTTTDMVDQLEAFIQLKIDRCNQMIDSLRERLVKS